MSKRPVTTVAEANAAIDQAIAILEAARPRGWRPRVGVGKSIGSAIGRAQAVRDFYSRVSMTPKSPTLGPLTHLDSIFLAATSDKDGPKQ